MEAVDRGDVGEDPCNDILRDSSLCELSAKYLQRKHATYVYKNLCSGLQIPPNLAPIQGVGM